MSIAEIIIIVLCVAAVAVGLAAVVAVSKLKNEGNAQEIALQTGPQHRGIQQRGEHLKMLSARGGLGPASFGDDSARFTQLLPN